MLKKLLLITLAALTVFAVTSCGKTDSKTYVILDEDFGSEEYGIGFRKGDNTLTLAVQNQIDAMISDGTAAEISTTWFGSDQFLKDAQFPREIKDEGDDSLKKIQDRGTLILGLDVGFKPMGYYDDKGEIVGFDIDVAKEVAKRLNVELKVQPIKWDAKEMELSGGNIDMIWNGMSITPDRVENMNVSKPYLANRMVVITAEGSGIKTLTDLSGKNVAVQAGSSALDAIGTMPEIKDTFAQLSEFEDNPTAFLDVKAGRCDALVVDEVVGRNLISK